MAVGAGAVGASTTLDITGVGALAELVGIHSGIRSGDQVSIVLTLDMVTEDSTDMEIHTLTALEIVDIMPTTEDVVADMQETMHWQEEIQATPTLEEEITIVEDIMLLAPHEDQILAQLALTRVL